ncbi:MAG TPA: TraM recognition domain-containing protein [Candidatus Saccharimonadales bacterium]|nr:TraM recognition domain-containing protein [Candidatus Saccharimonadales bacterium]
MPTDPRWWRAGDVDGAGARAHYARMEEHGDMRYTNGSAGFYGPPGGLKSSWLAIQAFMWNHTLFSITTKNDLARWLASYRSQLGPVWYIDWSGAPAPVPGMRLAHWSPLEGLDGPDGVDLAGERAKAMWEAANRGASAEKLAWAGNGTTLLKVLLFAAANAPGPSDDNGRMALVNKWLATKDMAGPTNIILDTGDRGAGLKDELAKVSGAADQTTHGMYFTVAPVLEWLTRTAVREITSRTDFDPVRFLTGGPATLLIIDPMGESQESPVRALTCGLFSRLISVARRLAAAEKGDDTWPEHHLRNRVLWQADEIAHTAPIDVVGLIGTVRELGFFSFATQLYGQIEAKYGVQGAKNMWALARYRILGPEVAEPELLSKMERLLGTQMVESKSNTTSSSGQGASTSFGERKEPIWSEAQLGQIQRGEAMLHGEGKGALIQLRHPRSIEPFRSMIGDEITQWEWSANSKSWQPEGGASADEALAAAVVPS